MHDKVPMMVAGMAAGVTPVLPGPTRSEWAAAGVALVTLVVREVIWWLRHRS